MSMPAPAAALNTPPLRPEDAIPRPVNHAAPVLLQPLPAGATPSPLFHGRPLRVLHGMYEIAGQGMMLAQALRAVGCDARAFSYQIAWDGRRSDIVVDLERNSNNLSRGFAMAGAFARWATWFDVFHLHFGTSFLPRRLDVPLLRALGKKVVFHFHGCEVRHRAHMLATHHLSTCTECDPFCRPAHQARILADAARSADLVLYSTLDLAESAPGASNLTLVIDAERWRAAAARNPLPDFARRDGVNGPVVVAHAPTNRLIKGTRHVVEAVERLRGEFPRVELRMIEHQPWATMPAFVSGCDILVDQLMMGWYGLLAIEGMAESRAVVAYLREDFRALRRDLPVVSAEPSTVYDVLRDLVCDPDHRATLGAQGPPFVRRWHDLEPVGTLLLAQYRRLLGFNDGSAPEAHP
jgi:glycosyltransferase involved in cell wall biosynthesis